ncbi:MAG: GLUG motif-containing protein, partial [Planctomycetota bacterium]
IGGLIGRSDGTAVTACFAESQVTAETGFTNLGGLIGTNYGSLSNSYSKGSLSGDENVGGLVGFNSTARSGSSPGSIFNCYSAADIAGTTSVGSVTGFDNGTGTYTSCFWDADLNSDVNGIGNLADPPNVISKTTLQMYSRLTFADAGWDFVNETVNGPNDIWAINDGKDYPVHIWPLVQFIDWDGVDFLDYGFFADYYGLIDCNDINDCNSTDLDFSGDVGPNDLDIFTTYWLFGK